MDEKTKQLILDYKEVFGTDAGKRVYDDLATKLNFNASFSIAVQSGVPEYTGSELGKREAFLYIKDKIEADPDKEVQETYGNDDRS